MDINVITDYNQFNISSQRHVNGLIKKIIDKGLGNDNCINLDLTDCQTDYPETPRLIDFLLDHLAKLNGEKELNIQFNGLGNKELYILHDLILDGKYFSITQKINSPNEVTEWSRIMSAKLKTDNIIIVIHYTPDNKIYTYGK
jgi:hypothetical protein